MTLSNFDAIGSGGGIATSPRVRAVETHTSRSLVIDENGRRRERNFLVWSRTGAGFSLPYSNAVLNELGIEYGSPHPEDPSIFAIEFEVRPLERMGRLGWSVRVGYKRVEVDGSEPPPGPTEPDFQEVNLAGEALFIDEWRSGAIAPSDTPGPGDIGGTKVDIAGQPRQVLIAPARYEIVRNYPLSAYAATTFLGAVGKRNNAVFLGFPTGSLLYAPPRSSRASAGVVRVVHSLALDFNFHLRQKPLLDANGVVLGPDGHAQTVEWFQPFPDKISFPSLNMIAPGTPVP